jgi:PPIC-type PPIASE domain
MMSAMMCFVPLLVFLSHSFATQTSTAPPAPIVDSLCLSEVLISTPQPYDPAQIAAAQRKADSAREAIRQGAKFEDIAKKYSDGPSAGLGGALGLFKHGQLAKSIEDRVFAMKVGDVSDVIRTKQGFLVLQVTECGRHGGSGSIEIPKAHQYGLGLGTIGRTVEGVEILSNTPGVELIPYLRIVVRNINRNWHGQIPASETRKGKLAIEFAIMKDGNLAAMWLVSRPGGPDDEALVRMAWASITKSNPFPPLPSEFTGSFLALRFRFDYSQR